MKSQIRKRPLGNAAVLVLAALARGCKYGFDVMDQTGQKSGTVYRALGRLEELGLTRSKWEAARVAMSEGRPRRRYYEITEAGAKELADARASLEDFQAKLVVQKR